MRALLPVLVLTATACSAAKQPPTPIAPVPTVAQKQLILTEAPVPKVVRRLLNEEKELVDRSLALAKDLPDPHGRARALAEAETLAAELRAIESPLAAKETTSEVLDDLMTKLLQIDTRVALLHESLRTATNHTTAVVIE